MQKAIFVFVILSLGLAVGFFAGRETAEERPLPHYGVEEFLDSEPIAEDFTPVPNQSQSENPATATHLESAVPAAAPVDPTSSVRAALAALPAPPQERGTGIITGQIKNDDGEPLAGVLVRATPHRSVLPDSRPDPTDSLEKVVLDFAAHTRRVRSATGSSTTDVDGNYQIDELLDSSVYDIRAELEGWSFKAGRGGSTRRSPGDHIEFTGRQVVKVPVEVTFADGRVPLRAQVRAQPDEAAGTAVRARLDWNPERKELELRPGTYKVTARESNAKEFVAEEIEVVIELGVQPEPLALVLEEQPGIRGSIRFPASVAPDTVIVRLVATESGGLASHEELLDGKKSTRARAYSGYQYRFVPLDPGTYTLGVQHGRSGPILTSANVVVGDAMTPFDLVVPALDPGDYLTVRVRRPDGSPLRDFSTSISYELADGTTNRSSTATIKQDDGSRMLLIVPPKKGGLESVVAATVRIRSKEYGNLTAPWTPGSTSRLDLAFEEPARLRVSVAGFVGSGLEDRLTLRVTSSAQQDRHSYEWSSRSWGGKKIDDAGTQKFGPFEPGEHTIVLNGKSTSGRSRTLATEVVYLNSGHNEATISIPPVYTLHVRADLETGTKLLLQRLGADRFTQSEKLNSLGVASFDTLLPGEYNLTASGPTAGKMTVHVPAQLDVVFAPSTANAVLVTILADDSKLEQAGFIDGDVIVTAGADSVVGVAQLRGEAQKVAAAEARLALQLLRGGRSVNLNVDPDVVLNLSYREGRFDSIHLP